MNSHSENNFLKIAAVLMLGIIAILALFPYALGNRFQIEEEALYIVIGSILSIALVIISDRLMSLKATKHSFELHMESMRSDLKSTIYEAKNIVRKDDPRFKEAEILVEKNREGDLNQEAKNIGKAMKMLREVMQEYKRENYCVTRKPEPA